MTELIVIMLLVEERPSLWLIAPFRDVVILSLWVPVLNDDARVSCPPFAEPCAIPTGLGVTRVLAIALST